MFYVMNINNTIIKVNRVRIINYKSIIGSSGT